MDKIKLRKKILLERENNPHINNKISNYLLGTLEYKRATNIFIYISTDKEIDTFKIINHAINNGKNVYVPKIISDGIMMATLYKLPLKANRYGILEPKGNMYAGDDIDLAVIPCLACDKYGHRIGYGAGYYDRFLKSFKGDKILLAGLLLDKIDINQWDIPADIIITERGVLNADK